MGTDNANIARRYLTEVWGKGNPAAIGELVHKDIVVRDNTGRGGGRGVEKVKEMVEMMHRSFADSSFTIEDVIVAGDRVVIRHTWRGTHTGPFHGIAATGRAITSQVVEVLRLAVGKVVEDIGYMDTYTMFQQLGVLPAPDQLGISSDKDRSDRSRTDARTASR